MNVYEAIRTRKSVRDFKDQPIEKEKLERILKAVRLAPSARNSQEWRFVIVQEKALRKKLAEAAYDQSFVGEGGAVVICCGESGGRIMRCGQDPVPIDVAIAIDHLTLAAVEEGLGTCWIGSFYPEKVRELCGIPEDIVIVELLALGYPKDFSPVKKNRLNLKEIVFYEKWK